MVNLLITHRFYSIASYEISVRENGRNHSLATTAALLAVKLLSHKHKMHLLFSLYPLSGKAHK